MAEETDSESDSREEDIDENKDLETEDSKEIEGCLLYTSPSPRD